MGGKTTVYCQISGCSPEIPLSIWWYEMGMTPSTGEDSDMREGEPAPGPLVKHALRSLMSDDEKEGQLAITVIGSTDDDGNLPYEGNDHAREDIPNLPDTKIRVQQCYVDPDSWDYGAVWPCGDNPDGIEYVVSFGGSLMVQNTALDILRVATSGRMTPERFWRTAMVMGTEGYSITGIHYGKMSELPYVHDQFPEVVPAMKTEEIIALEDLGDFEKIKQYIVHRGCFWIWMRPDRFPTQIDVAYAEGPIHIKAPGKLHEVSAVENLPPEIFTIVASHATSISDLLSFASTSHQLRYIFLGVASNRDAIARAWIRSQAPWYIPPHRDNDDGTESGGSRQSADGTDVVLSWGYLRQCCASGSMRNRRRIWRIAELLEKKAIERGL